MSRFRLLPSLEQDEALRAHCRDARYVWNLAVEQRRHWQPGRKAPDYGEQCTQLTIRNFFAAQKRGLNRAISRSGWGQVVMRLHTRLLDGAARGPAHRPHVTGLDSDHVEPAWRKTGVHEGFLLAAVGIAPRAGEPLIR